MRRRVLLVGCVMVIGILWMLWPLHDPNPQLHPPIRHPDGTTEYRLINSGQDRKDGTSDDQHWVLRLPAGLWFHTMDEDRTEQQKKDNPDYPYNTQFSFIVGLPEFEFVQDPYEGSLTDNLRVSVASRILRYGTGKFEGRADLTFSSQHDLKANFNCRKAAEIGPGVFRLRKPTDAEVRQMGETYGTDPHRPPSKYFFPPKCGSVDLYGNPRDLYAVYDHTNRPIGHGRCSASKQSAPSKCTFWFWMQFDKELQFSLSAAHVPQLQSIYTQVTDLLLTATDTAKSRNLVGAHRHSTAGRTSSP